MQTPMRLPTVMGGRCLASMTFRNAGRVQHDTSAEWLTPAEFRDQSNLET